MPYTKEHHPNQVLGGEEASGMLTQAQIGPISEETDGSHFPSNYPGDSACLSPVRKKSKHDQFEQAFASPESLKYSNLNTRGFIEDYQYDGEESVGVSGVDVGCEGVEQVENVGACVKKMRDEALEILSKWKESFTDCESFEEFCPSRMDELLKEALAYEQDLIRQKQVIKKRLQMISQTLD